MNDIRITGRGNDILITVKNVIDEDTLSTQIKELVDQHLISKTDLSYFTIADVGGNKK